MVNLSLREAVKQFDVSRPTLLKSLKIGKISAVKDDQGNWKIDPAELARIYVARNTLPAGNEPSDQGKFPTFSHPFFAEAEARIAELEAELEQERIRREAAEAIAEERRWHIEDLRRLLPSPEQPKALLRAAWWPWRR